MALLTKEAILAASDLRFETVAVPEWGGEVRIRAWNGTARDEYEQSLVLDRDEKSKNIRNVRARIVAFSVVGEDGELLFSAADIEALGKKSAKALDRVFEKVQKLNALSDQDVEALEKN